MNSSSEDSGQSRWQKIDQLCDRYERETRDGKNPPISDALQQAKSSEEREQLLRELIRIDLDLAGQTGKTISVEKYLAELPEHSEAIKASYDRYKNRASRNTSVVEPQLQPGQEIGAYQIVKKIGEGGMGHVYLARHNTMDRDVALKVLTPKLMDSPDAVARFHREIKAAAKLNHPNIVTAHDAGELDGLHFLVMEFVDGRDLSSYVKSKGPLSLKQAIKCTMKSAQGLAYAHEQNIIHRDIKPANLLVDRQGNVKVLDMGLARFEIESENHELTDLTGTGMVMGTIDYMAPEQSLDTRTADARSDIYSLGCTFWYLLTGKSVYDGDTLMKKLLAHREEEIPSLSKQFESVPAVVDDVFQKMIAKDQSDRYQSMSEVIDALQNCLTRKSSSRSSSDLSMAADPKLASFLADVDVPKMTSAKIEYEDSKSHTNPHEATVIGQATGASSTQKKQPAVRSIGKLPKWLYGVAAGVLALAVAAFLIPGSGDQSKQKNEEGVPAELSSLVAFDDVKWLPTDAQESAADLLATGEWEWRIDKNLGPAINSPAHEKCADISADGNLAVMARTSMEWHTQDFWVATRDSIKSGWKAAVKLPGSINTREALEHPILMPDGSGLLFTKRLGKVPPTIIQWSQRASAASDWTPSSEFELPGGGPYASIDISVDGRTMIVSRLTVVGKNDLLWSQRSSTSESWPEPVPIGTPINTNGDEYTGTISNDRRMLIFQRGPDRGPDQKIIGPDLWMSLRPSEDAEWSTPVSLDALNSPQRDAKPRLLADGKTLIFSSDRPGGQGGLDIWQARLVPKERPAKSQPATEGMKSKVLYFDGEDDWVNAPHYVPDTTKPFTMEFWISIDEGMSSTPMHIANGGSVYIRTDKETRVYVKYMTSPDTAQQLKSKPPLKSGGTHVAVCFDGEWISFYLQGKLIENRPLSDRNIASKYSVSLAGWNEKQAVDDLSRFAGSIREFRISSISRYETDFVPEKRFSRDQHTELLLHLDEGEGAVAIDSSGHNRDVKIYGAQWIVPTSGAGAEWVTLGSDEKSKPPSLNYALKFDGVDDLVMLKSIDHPVTEPVTYEMTVFYDPPNDKPSQGQMFVAPHGSLIVGPQERPMMLLWHALESRAILSLADSSPMEAKRKYQFAACWDGTIYRLFVDGKLVDQAPLKEFPVDKFQSWFAIGGHVSKSSSQGSLCFPGVIDEVRISNIARYTENYKTIDRFEPDENTVALYHFDEGTGRVLKDSSQHGHDGTVQGAEWVRVDRNLNVIEAEPSTK